MKKIIITVIAAAISSGVVNALELENMSAKDVVKTAQETQADVKLPEAKFGQLIDLTRDCKKITFGAADALISPEVSLVSRETTQDCQNMGYPAGQICFPNTRYYRENVQVVIKEPRVLQQDQKEVFEVCLWGSFLSLKQVSPAYTYAVRQVPGAFELTPVVNAGKAAAQDVCTFKLDTNLFCVYRCNDGSYLSKPHTFGPPSFSGDTPELHGCSASVPNTH